MLNIFECLHRREASRERRLVSTKQRLLWSMLFVIIGCMLASPQNIYSQWTASGNDISNTNTGNVGVGTGGTAPVYKLNVSGTEDKSQIRFGLGAFDSGGFLFSNAPTHAVFSGGASWNGAWFAKGINASSIKMDTGTITFYTNSGLTQNTQFAPTARMYIDAGGNVGIGSTAPSYRLDVQGGQVNASGGLCIGGDCKTAWSQVGGGSSQWTTSGSTIYYGGNVGIGTSAAPTRKLEVVGGNVFHQWSTTAGSEYGFYTATSNNHLTSNLYYDGQWKMITTGKGAIISVSPTVSQAFAVWSENTSRAANTSPTTLSQLLSVTMSGNVGIGIGTPDSLAKLHVYGSGAFGQDIQSTTNDWTRLRFITPARSWGFFLDAAGSTMGAGKFGLYDYTANQFRMAWDTAGNVGIGTTAPVYSLDVSGGVNGFRAKAATAASGDTIASFENNSAIQMIVRGNGNVGIGTTSPTEKLEVSGNIKVSGNINAKYQDVAEWVESSEELPAGTVVVLDSRLSNQVIASTKAYDSRVAGVISLKPGITLGEQGEGHVLVATTGRVKVKVDATNGPIEIGDLLVTGEKTGVAMKSVPIDFAGAQIHRPGTILGKALEPLAKGTGEILVLLSLQ